ncbi:MAG TPA: hypothetical protein VFF54_04190 [Thermodesulfobacteriota bacterium]|nr:hypothetical protein [Thermodesulfobacteriota bacterium]
MICKERYPLIAGKERRLQMTTGIKFVMDERGQKVAVQIDLKKLGGLWEDLYDNLIAKKRANETRESLESVKAVLRHKKTPLRLF